MHIRTATVRERSLQEWVTIEELPDQAQRHLYVTLQVIHATDRPERSRRRGQVRSVEHRMVEGVEELHPVLQRDPLFDPRILDDRRIHVVRVRLPQTAEAGREGAYVASRLQRGLAYEMGRIERVVHIVGVQIQVPPCID